MRRIHLIVSGHHDAHVVAELEDSSVAAQDRFHAPVQLVADDHHPGIPGCRRPLGGAVGREVVDDHDVVDQCRHVVDHVTNVIDLVVSGDDDGDPMVLVHRYRTRRTISVGVADTASP